MPLCKFFLKKNDELFGKRKRAATFAPALEMGHDDIQLNQDFCTN